MFNTNQDYWAEALLTEKFLSISTYSGLGLTGADPLFPSNFLSPEADDRYVGEVVFKALLNSRTLTLEEYGEYFDIEKGESQYSEWVSMIMDRYCYKNKRELFKNMKSITIRCFNGMLTIKPTRHDKLESWVGTNRKDDIVVIPVISSFEEIGAALRLAFSRCV